MPIILHSTSLSSSALDMILTYTIQLCFALWSDLQVSLIGIFITFVYIDIQDNAFKIHLTKNVF